MSGSAKMTKSLTNYSGGILAYIVNVHSMMVQKPLWKNENFTGLAKVCRIITI